MLFIYQKFINLPFDFRFPKRKSKAVYLHGESKLTLLRLKGFTRSQASFVLTKVYIK